MPTIVHEFDLESGITPTLQLFEATNTGTSKTTGATSGSPVTGNLVSGSSLRYRFSITANVGDYYAQITGGGEKIATDCFYMGASSYYFGNDWFEIEAWKLIAAGNSITVYPLSGTAVDRVSDTTITVYLGEEVPVSVSITGSSVDLTTKTLRLIIENAGTADQVVIEDANITTTASTFTFTVPDTLTTSLNQYEWSLRELPDNIKLAGGVMLVKYSPTVDAS